MVIGIAMLLGSSSGINYYNNTSNSNLDFTLDLNAMAMKLENDIKVLRQLLEWAYECDFGFDQIATDDDFDFDKFYEETKDMNSIDSMLYYTERWMDKNEPDWRS